MAYDKYTTETVFTNQNINAVCNSILQFLIDEFTLSEIETKFCLSGTVAKIIQGATTEEITVIPYVTKDLNIFSFCSNKLPKLINASAVKLNDRVQLNYNGFYFEVWYESALGIINTVTGIQVEDPADISLKIK